MSLSFRCEEEMEHWVSGLFRKKWTQEIVALMVDWWLVGKGRKKKTKKTGKKPKLPSGPPVDQNKISPP